MSDFGMSSQVMRKAQDEQARIQFTYMCDHFYREYAEHIPNELRSQFQADMMALARQAFIDAQREIVGMLAPVSEVCMTALQLAPKIFASSR